MFKGTLSAAVLVAGLASTAAAQESVDIVVTPDGFEPHSWIGYSQICDIRQAVSADPLSALAAFCDAQKVASGEYNIAKATCDRDHDIREAETDLQAAKEGWDYDKKSEQNSANYELKSECDGVAIDTYLGNIRASFQEQFPSGITLTLQVN